ncbi:MAG: cytochrome P450 [Methylotenera sp.]|nr:cytochrome P450 [Oligoflexia bacterium]
MFSDPKSAAEITATAVPPGPRGIREIFQVMKGRKKDPLDLYLRLVARYGDLVYFKVGNIAYALVNDPDAIKWVLQENSANYVKGPGYERLRDILGHGLLTSNGDHWKRQRKLAAPAFHQRQVQGSFASILRMTDEMTDEMTTAWKLRTGPAIPVDLSAEMNRITLRIASEALLGSDTTSRSDDVRIHLQEALKFMDSRGMVWLRLLDFFLPSGGKAGRQDSNLAFRLEKKFPTKANRDFQNSVRILHEVVMQIIQARRSSGDYGTDLLGVMMKSKLEKSELDSAGPSGGESGSMNDRQLQDEVTSLLMAGHETTATALTWCWYFLGKYPEIHEKLKLEIDHKLQGEPPTFESLFELTHLSEFFSEVIRYYPPFWRVTRQALQDDQVLGQFIPAGTTMILCPLLTHRNPRHWKDPDTFNPDRFNEADSKARHRFAYFPFGAGPRVCIGANFAVMEALLVLCRMIQNCEIEIVIGPPLELEAQITLKSKHPLLARVKSRATHSRTAPAGVPS